MLCRKERRRQRAGPPAAAPTRFDDLSGSDGIRSGMATFDDLWAEQMHAMQRAHLEMTEMQRMVRLKGGLQLAAQWGPRGLLPVTVCHAAAQVALALPCVKS